MPTTAAYPFSSPSVENAVSSPPQPSLPISLANVAPDANKPVSLTRNIIAPVLLAGSVNAIIYALGWNQNNQVSARLWYAPAGYMIGIMWVILFAMMGVVRNYVIRANHLDGINSARALDWFIFACATYPAYTIGFRSMPLSFCGALITVVWSLYIKVRLYPVSRKASMLFTPVLLWSIYATFLTVQTVLASN